MGHVSQRLTWLSKDFASHKENVKGFCRPWYSSGRTSRAASGRGSKTWSSTWWWVLIIWQRRKPSARNISTAKDLTEKYPLDESKFFSRILSFFAGGPFCCWDFPRFGFLSQVEWAGGLYGETGISWNIYNPSECYWYFLKSVETNFPGTSFGPPESSQNLVILFKIF